MANESTKMHYERMSIGLIEASLAEKQVTTKGKTLPAKALALLRWFEANVPEEDRADCTECGGVSEYKLDKCPYCGGADAEAGADAILQVEAAKPPKPKRAKVASGTPAPANVIDIKKRSPLLTEDDLDKSVAHITQLKNTAAHSIWELGVEIKRNYDSGLWKLRLGEDGTVRHKTWTAFCTAELGMSANHAYNLIAVAAAFTAEEVREFGAAKLTVALQLPPEQRTQLLEDIKAGATLREVKERKRELRDGASSAPKKGNDTKASQEPPTIVSFMVRTPESLELDMLGANNRGMPATSIEDDPWAEEEHENGVITRYVVKAEPNTGAFKLYITRRRA